MDNTTSTATLPSFAPGVQAAAPEPAQAYEPAPTYTYPELRDTRGEAAELLVVLDSARCSCQLAAELLEKTADGPADALLASFAQCEPLLSDELQYLVEDIRERTAGLGADARRLYERLDKLALTNYTYSHRAKDLGRIPIR